MCQMEKILPMSKTNPVSSAQAGTLGDSCNGKSIRSNRTCKYCGKELFSISYLRSHLRRMHQSYNYCQYKDCQQHFTSTYDLQLHVIAHKIGSYVETSESEMNNADHISKNESIPLGEKPQRDQDKVCTETEATPCVCLRCQAPFECLKAYHLHEKRCNLPWTCGLCKTTYTKITVLLVHLKSGVHKRSELEGAKIWSRYPFFEEKTSKNMCDICKRDFTNLESHIRSFHIDVLDFCRQQFVGILKNEMICTNCNVFKGKSLTEVEEHQVLCRASVFKCLQCKNLSFPRIEMLFEHYNKFHECIYRCLETHDKSHVCYRCNVDFDCRQKCKRHREMCELPWKCGVCEMEFAEKAVLLVHLKCGAHNRSELEKARIWERFPLFESGASSRCDICEKKFSKLKPHIFRYHKQVLAPRRFQQYDVAVIKEEIFD